jgi:LuxR family maltose regulon positive regulatory protein
MARLKSGLSVRLTLISAPAGYGKTTLLCDGLRAAEIPVAWLSLDHGDNDPAAFWPYLVAALQTVCPDVGRSVLGVFQSPQAAPMEWVLATLINEIGTMPEDFALVLDDYHEIQNQAIHESMIRLVDRMPSQMHLLLVTRADPPLPLARLRARGHMNELRAADLRFTPEEAAELLNDVLGLGLSPEGMATVEARSEGWIVGLRMAALSIQATDDVAEFIDAFGGGTRHILDYLTEEVMEKQPPGIQDFLMRTCVLERLTSAVCDAITGGADGQEVLERLESENLFVVPLDDRRLWYRYHRLFSDLLRARAARQRPDLVRDSHSKASLWFEGEGLTAEAVNHAVASRDFGRVVELVEPAALGMIAENRYATVSEWLSRIPEELLAEHPWLCVAGAWASLAWQRYDAMRTFLQRAETRLSEWEAGGEGRPADWRSIRGHLLTLRAMLAVGENNLDEAIGLGHEVLREAPVDDLLVGSTIMATLGMAFAASGDLASGRVHFKEAAERAKSSGNHYLAIGAIAHMADIEAQLGHLHTAAATYRQALQLAREWASGEYPPVAGWAFVGLSDILYEWNDLDEAASLLAQGLKLAELSGEVETTEKALQALARLRHAQGQDDGVHEALERARQLAPASTRLDYQHVAVSTYEARMWLSEGRLAEAVDWANNRERRLRAKDVPDFRSEATYLTWARVKIAGGDLEEIPESLERLREAMSDNGRTGAVIEVLVLEALACQAQGRVDEATGALGRALSLAKPEGYVRVFVDEGQPMTRLLQRAAAEGVELGYVSSLLAALGQEPSRRKQPESALAEPLTTREQEVLRLIAAGLSNHAVAETLVVTDGTVKKHLSNIFGKLGARSRTEAVARARELNAL